MCRCSDLMYGKAAHRTLLIDTLVLTGFETAVTRDRDLPHIQVCAGTSNLGAKR